MQKYPWQCPYVAFDNNPIFYIDITGASSDSTITKHSAESTFNPETGNVEIDGTRILNIQMNNEDSDKGKWTGTIVEVEKFHLEIDENGNIVKAESSKTFLGWGPDGSWDLSHMDSQSNLPEDISKSVMIIATRESEYIKTNKMSHHQYLADYTRRRNRQNEKEWGAGIPVRLFTVVTGNFSTALIDAGAGVFDYNMSPSSLLGELKSERATDYKFQYDGLSRDLGQ